MNGPTIWLPYCGAAPLPDEWLARWNLDTVLLLILAAASVLLARHRGVSPLRHRCGQAAIALTALLFVSPFCALGSALFSARAVHHVLLATVLGPLLSEAFGLHRHRLPGSLTLATALQALVFWFWHVPAVYGAALSSDAVFWAMQLTITGTAAFWYARLRSASAGAATIALLATMVQMGVLGALLLFAGSAFYAPHYLTTAAWGFSPLEDQQIAGLIMWAPASAIYLLAAVVTLNRSLQPAPVR